jgi:wobble nucleotide-excising tRNase
MITAITLPTDRFNSSKIENLKKKNFIYGNNGTGKSTITNEIKMQFQNDYDVRIFQGFDSVIDDNEQLNAIALGQENAQLQPQVSAKEQEISTLETDISQPSNGGSNTFTVFEKANNDYMTKQRHINDFCKTSASDMKNNHTHLTGANYIISNFKNDIPNAEKLSSNEISTYEKTLKETMIDVGQPLEFPDFDLASYLASVNEILMTEVTKNAILNFNTDQENWVRTGLELHQSVSKCIFCDNEISIERLTDLNSYFSIEVKKQENKIEKCLTAIQTLQDSLSKFKFPSKKNYYFKSHDGLQIIQLDFLKIKDSITTFLVSLEKALNSKKSNLFERNDCLEVKIPEDFQKIKSKIATLFEENKKFGESLSIKQGKAKESLRHHMVYEKLKTFNYPLEEKNLKDLELLKKTTDENLKTQQRKLDEAKRELRTLIEKTKDEEASAIEINKYLKGLGNQSFEIIKIDALNGKKGQYQVSDLNGKKRNINQLSTGERNIVAFLWFLYDLQNTEKETTKEKVIVFDDPMNSNDNTTQYLIISKIQELFKNGKYANIFVLLHNVHFYLNARFKRWYGSTKRDYDKATRHLRKLGAVSEINFISCESSDFKNNYETLWAELKFLYTNEMANLMLNPCRRILETYQKFNSIESDIYGSDAESQKLFNVNSQV